jgi:tRNA U54 and U55 pseudouridine synthase Pus10
LKTTLEVTDLFRGAYLLASGANLAGVRMLGRGRPPVLFSFTGRDLARLDRDYRCGRALVNPLELLEALNHLRDVMFARLRQQTATPAGGRKG